MDNVRLGAWHGRLARASGGRLARSKRYIAGGRDARQTRGQDAHATPNSRGFTLVELMIALGILAFALPMIGTAFLAGMVENKESNDNTMLTLVAENAISIASSRLSETALTGCTETLAPVPKSVVNPAELEWRPYGQAGLNYPADPVAENAAGVYGCVLFARHWPNTTANVVGDYQIVAMVFRKVGTINWLMATVDGTSTVVLAANGAVDVKNSKVSVNSVLQSVMGGYQVRMSLRP